MSEMPQNNPEENVPEEERAEKEVTASEELSHRADNVPFSEENVETTVPKRKKEKKVSLFTFILTSVTLILAAVMTTYAVSSAIYKQKLAEAQLDYAEYSEKGYPFELFSQFIDKYTFGEVDEEELMAAALKSYVAATGDKYAYYYTADEYEQYQKSSAGETEGIGINIVSSEAEIDGATHKVIQVINVTVGSPAEKNGIKRGDLIYGVGIGDGMRTVDEIGQDMAITELIGEAGTKAEFTVYRPTEKKMLTFSIERREITVDSVYYRVHSTDKSVGIVTIFEFDLTTPKQFEAAMDKLIEQGCTKFVLDVRNNPGGDLRSIQAVLGFFLNEGDVTIRTVYKDGTEEIDTVKAVSYSGDYADCSLSKDDIGKYNKDEYSFAVLCNGRTASAGELFTATFRDYALGTVVGTQTYGKGSLQNIMSLARYGYSGALKLTVAKYYSGANGGMNDGYDGVGITPHEVVELSEEAASKSVYLLTDEEDAQLVKALECFK